VWRASQSPAHYSACRLADACQVYSVVVLPTNQATFRHTDGGLGVRWAGTTTAPSSIGELFNCQRTWDGAGPHVGGHQGRQSVALTLTGVRRKRGVVYSFIRGIVGVAMGIVGVVGSGLLFRSSRRAGTDPEVYRTTSHVSAQYIRRTYILTRCR
jgi:hypothetical protein